MLNYDYQVEGDSNFNRDEQPPIGGNLVNPFPGLRPFDIDESHLFFGREDHVHEILLKLAEQRFVTILGYSGSGKSSLMYCGVIPVLHGGFMTQVGTDWNVIAARPGSDPIGNLSASILKNTRGLTDESSPEFQLKKTISSAVLRSGSDGLVKAIKQFKRTKNENFLILIDQFEELFRYRYESESDESIEESIAFVEMLLHAIQQQDEPIYVALTMRSDFMGDCSMFQGLTSRINKSNYLVPRMTREQKKLAIEGPVSVGGGIISSRLARRLIDEVGDNQDQLPLLQHALMRTWDNWVENRDDNEPLDIRHYNAVGQISGALSQHADEIFDDLDPGQKNIAEVLFKALTRKGQDNQGLRRPARLGFVAQLAGVSNEEVIEVVEHFRKPGRSFLMPAIGVSLDEDSVIEISHESLMRIWVRLKAWVEEEHESAQMYLRLSEAAEMYQIGRTGLWRPPDLQLALNWQKKQKPNRLWAQQYNEAFERAIVFLDTSRITYEAEQKNQEMLQRRLLKRTRVVAIILGIAAIIAIAFFVYGIIQQQAAEENYRIAQQERDAAQVARDDAQQQRDAAQEARDDAIEARERAEGLNRQLQAAYDQLEEQNVALAEAIKRANAATREAQRQEGIALAQKDTANLERLRAEENFDLAQRNFMEAQRLLYLIMAQNLAAISVTQEDTDLQGLLAMQGFLFNKEFGGREYNPYIYIGLYEALKSLDGETHNTIDAHLGSVRAVEFHNSPDIYYTTGSDGHVIKNSLANPENQEIISTLNFRNSAVRVSPSGNYIVSGGDSTFVHLYDANNQAEELKTLPIHRSYINEIIWHPDDKRIITSGGDRTIRITDINTGNVRTVRNSNSEYRVMDITPSGSYLLAGAEDGRISLFNMSNFAETVVRAPNGVPVYSLAFSKDETSFTVGDESGSVSMWDTNTATLIRSLTGHKARVTSIEYSDDGNLLATSSLDRTMYVWVLDELDKLPIHINDNDSYVWDIDFSPDSQFLLAACDDGEIRVWPANSETMANKMCDLLSRNMTIEEWNTYINKSGDDESSEIPFANTCIDKILDK